MFVLFLSFLTGIIGTIITTIALIFQPNIDFLGNSENCRSIPQAAVSCYEAHEMASPFLQTSFQYRQKYMEVNRNMERETIDNILQSGKYYVISRDNYPAKNADFYIHYGIKIHKDTGEIIVPWLNNEKIL